MPNPLDKDDPVLACIRGMQSLLELLPVKYLLTNGKVEKQLKFFMGAAWEKPFPESRASATDKRPFQNLEFDIVAFENRSAKFWAEVKCSFRKDNNDVMKSAVKATNQAMTRIDRVPRADLNCDGYIVHFLNSLPEIDQSQLPAYILNLYQPLIGNTPITEETLKTQYEKMLQGYCHSSAVIQVWTDPKSLTQESTVSAIVIKLQHVVAMS